MLEYFNSGTKLSKLAIRFFRYMRLILESLVEKMNESLKAACDFIVIRLKSFIIFVCLIILRTMGYVVCSYVTTEISYFISVISTNKQDSLAAVNDKHYVTY